MDNNKGFKIVENNEYENDKKSTNRKSWIILIFILAIICSFLAGNLIPYSILGKNKSIASGDLSLYSRQEDLKKLIKEKYFGDASDETLNEGALKGIAASVGDPYTVYMNKKEYADFNNQTAGEYVGVGLQVGAKENRIAVITTFDGSPAQKAGVHQGDIILKVNGVDVSGDDLEKATTMMKGQKNTEVTVTFYREGKGEFDLKITRDVISLVSVKSEMLENKIGYIQLSSFDEKTGKEFDDAINKLKGDGMKGLILDLRGNPGGLLTSCQEVASNFINKGDVILTMKDKAGNEKSYDSNGGVWKDMPTVVLIDGGSASASEVLAGALRDHKAATLIGEKSFGKGIVQDLYPLSDGAGLKITVYQYFTPNGEFIHKKGIEPDIAVKYPDELKGKTYERSADPQFSKALEEINTKIK